MQTLRSRVAYLQGLSSGMNLNASSDEGKLLTGIIDVLEDFARSFDGLEAAHQEMEDYLDSIDEDLCELEDTVYEGREEFDSGSEYLEVECPNCGEIVCFEAGILETDDIIEVTCPHCDQVAFVNDAFINEVHGDVHGQGQTGPRLDQ